MQGSSSLKAVLRNLNIWKEDQVKFVVTCNRTKLSFFTNTLHCKAGIFFCGLSLLLPRMSPRLYWKTERTLWERINEPGYCNKENVIYNHITNCKGVSYLVDLLNINKNSTEREKIDRKTFSVNIVKENTCIIDKARQGNILLFKEALMIK